MIAASRQIGLVFGFFDAKTNRVEVSAAGQGTRARLELLSDAELTAMLEAGQATAL
jgi:hypothetical protein